MSDNGDGGVLELSSGELEGDNSANSKFKCNLSSENIPLTMGLTSEYCNNGGTSAGNLGLNLLQNFDESNLFHCDISGAFEWIRQRTDSVSSADLECMRIDSNEAIVTTSELTSSNQEPVCVGSDIDSSGQLDPTFSAAVSTSLTSHSQSDHLNSALLDELTCLQTDDHITKVDHESLINESVFHYSLSQKEIARFDNFSNSSETNVKSISNTVSKDLVPENSLICKSGEENKKSELKIFKCASSLPFVKVPKKCILSGKILKKDAYLLNKTLFPTLSEQSSYEIPQEIQSASINSDIVAVPHAEFSSESLCDSGFENSEEIQLLLTEERLKSPLIDENLPTNENEALLAISPDNQEKSGAKTIVAISTNKLEDVTEVCIKTEKGEELYKGKASELLKATNSSSNLLLKFDHNFKDRQKLQLQKSGTINLDANTDEPIIDDDKTNGTVNEDEPITEALKALGITNDHWDNFEVMKGQQRSWFCPVEQCNDVFSKLSSLKVHILTHYKLRPFKCNYLGCEWSFYTNFRLKRHKETHLKKKEFQCPLENCNRSFTTIYNLHTHLKLHERPADLLCPVPGCSQAFQTKRNMESHLKEHGTEHAPYACTVEGCQKRYYSPSALQSHSRTHMHNINDLKCEYCFKIFDKPCRLKAHLRSHTGVKPYKCNYEGCDWAFTTSSKLHRHQAKHTQERRFVCNLCCQGFLRSEHLKDHQLKHFLTKAFVCPVEGCGQQFTAKSSLYVHLKKHRKKDGESSETGKFEKHNGLVSLLNDAIKISCPIEDCQYVSSFKHEIAKHIQRCHKNINIEVKDLNACDSIELMTGDDNLISLEGLQFKNDSSIDGLNLTNLCPEGVVISLPEYINTDFSGLSVLNASGSINQVEFAENLQNNAKNITSLNNICTVTTTRSDIGCARTGLTYQDALAERELRKSLNKKPTIAGRKRGPTQSDISLKDNSAMQVTSDIILTTGLLGGSQETLSRGLTFQDNLADGMDSYGSVLATNSALQHNSAGQFFQVYIVDSSSVKGTDFEQSTINFRDLE